MTTAFGSGFSIRWVKALWPVMFPDAKTFSLDFHPVMYRCFVEIAGTVDAQSDAIVIHFDKRSHNPILREAALDKESPPIPWLDNRPIRFTFP